MKKQPGDAPACVECDHYIGSKCHSDDNSDFDPVRGRLPVIASHVRSMKHCGPHGLDFRARPMPSWIDRHVGRILFGVIVVALIGYWLKQSGVFG